MTGRNKRQRLHEGEQADDRSGVDVRLNDELRGLLGWSEVYEGAGFDA